MTAGIHEPLTTSGPHLPSVTGAFALGERGTIGPRAISATALIAGTAALSAVAVLGIAYLAIYRLTVKEAVFKKVKIDELDVGSIRVRDRALEVNGFPFTREPLFSHV